MDKTTATNQCSLGETTTTDLIVRLRSPLGKTEDFNFHSSVLIKKSKFFADRLSGFDTGTSCLEIKCAEFNFEHHVNLLRSLLLPEHSVLDLLSCVKSALGILQVSVALKCEEIVKSCVHYLEAVPWEDKEEEDILRVVSRIGPIGIPILARMQPVDVMVTKDVFVSAIRFAMSIGGSCPPFGDEIKRCAQEQVDYMLGEDEDTPLVTADEEVKSAVKLGLTKIFSLFEEQLRCLLFETEMTNETDELEIMHTVSDLEWTCNILPKIELMKEFVSNWVESSSNVLHIIEDKKLESKMWGLKLKMIELTGKALDAVGYGSVILPAASRSRLLKSWLPYIRKMKPLMDSKCNEDVNFTHEMGEDLCQSIEGAITSLILALPSNDQADIFADWMKADQIKYPDLSEAFEVWCYRTKSAKRRLLEGSEGGSSNAEISL